MAWRVSLHSVVVGGGEGRGCGDGGGGCVVTDSLGVRSGQTLGSFVGAFVGIYVGWL